MVESDGVEDEELPLLLRDAGQVRGRTYSKAEGRLAIKSFRQPDGRVYSHLSLR